MSPNTSAAPHGPVQVNTLAVKTDGSRVYSSRGQVWSGDLTTQLGSFVPIGNEIEYSDTLQKFFITYDSQVNEYDVNSYTLMRQHHLFRIGGVARVNAAGTFLYVSTNSGIVAVDLITGDLITADIDTQFWWPMFMPAILSGGGCKIDPLWGAYTTICCSDSSLTFSVTVSGKTKRSTADSCAATPTWDGMSTTTAGSKNVVWEITSRGCGSYKGTFPLIMEKGKAYLFQLELVGGEPHIIVNTGDACTVSQKTSEIKSSSLPEKATGEDRELLHQVKDIKLDISPGAFKEKKLPACPFQTVR